MNQEQFQSIGAEAGLKPDATPVPGAAPTAGAPAPTPEGGTPAPEVAHPYIEAMATNLKLAGIDYKAPEGFNEMTPDKQFEVLKNEIITYSNQTEDPFISSYRDAKAKGIAPGDFVKGYTNANAIYTLPSKEFMMKYLQVQNGKTEENVGGWTNEEIEAHVGGMGKIELDMEAKKLKAQMQEANKNQPIAPEDQAKYDERLKIANEAITETSAKLFAQMANLTDIGGIPHTVDDQKEFQQIFGDLVGLNPETGKARVQDFFNTDEVLYKALFLLHKAESTDSSIKGFLSGFKEGYKKEILDKTRINPRDERGNLSTAKIPKPEDFA